MTPPFRSVAPSDLVDELALSTHELVSIVGGGGKTTTLFLLGAARSGRTILTTTTKMGRDHPPSFAALVGPTDEELELELARSGGAIVWSEAADHKAVGVAPEDCDRWFDLVDTLVVEADGSRRKPFKAPAPYEPVVPRRTTTLLACIGADALGQPIEVSCHRPERVAAIAGGSVDDALTPSAAAAVLLDREGSRKGLPDGAEFVVLITKVTDRTRNLAAELAARLAPTTRVLGVNEGRLSGA